MRENGYKTQHRVFKVLETLHDINPNRRITRYDLSRASGIPVSTITYHLSQLVFTGAVLEKRHNSENGRGVVCSFEPSPEAEFYV